MYYIICFQRSRYICEALISPHLLSHFCFYVPSTRRKVANALCEMYGFMPELHRYATCEPEEVASVADYWISPHAIGECNEHLQELLLWSCLLVNRGGYHGYKNMSLLLHAYRASANPDALSCSHGSCVTAKGCSTDQPLVTGPSLSGQRLPG